MPQLKTYTITCHRPLNYGAVLQAYALNNKLTSLGIDAKVIDYYPRYYIYSSRSWPIEIVRRIYWLPDWIVGKIRFGKFIKENIPLSPVQYKNMEELNSNAPIADIYIAGSDQIWNCNSDTGKDDAYFLTFAPKNAKKVAYAASLAMPDIPANEIERYKKLISDFDAVSIREKTGVELIKNLGIENAVNVLDPVYLLEKTEWDRIAKQSKFQSKEKYVLVYGFERNIYLYARKLANQLGIKVYTINMRIKDLFIDTDRYFWNVSPNTFVNLIKNAEAVVTNSFHGISFSIIYNRPFHCFNRKGNANSRMLDLLNDLNSSDRNVVSTEFLSNDIDYTATNKIIEQKRDFSIDFLKTALDL
jgi:hypothetical protein